MRIVIRYFRSLLAFSWLAIAAHAAEPPPMPLRPISPDPQPPKGKKIPLTEGDLKFTLFVPDAWQTNNPRLTVHFHTAEWFVIQEHLRRGATHPIAAFYLGEGSTVYRRAFEDANRFGHVLGVIEHELSVRPRDIEVSSFSAGYGAVREIIRNAENVKRIRTIFLADSMYAGLETNGSRQPLREHIDVWAPFARAAMQREKTFIFTYSAVPTATYASSSECAHALLSALGVSDMDVPPNSSPAASDTDFPLLRRADFGNLHVWGYGGTNAQAHMTHPRHAADIWKAIER